MIRVLTWLRAQLARLTAEVRKARAGAPKRGPNDRVVLVPRGMGPVVESRDTKHPVPLSRVPVRSSKADVKRAMHRAAEQHAGRSMTWGEAQRYLARLEREHPDAVLAVPAADARRAGLTPTARRKAAR